MRFLIEVGLEDLQHLPERFRQQIQAALGLPSAPAQQPVYQQPVPQQFAPVQPQAFQAPPVMPARQPIVEGNKQIFPADRSHFSQQNIAVDVLTGQPVQIGNTPPPSVPVVQGNAPVSVAPVGMPAPAAVAPPMPIDVAAAKASLMRTYNRTDVDGKAIAAQALKDAGVINFASLTADNIPMVAQALTRYGVTL
jgi:hypothetical protein